MTVIELGARHRRPEASPLDAPTVPIVLIPQPRQGEQKAAKARPDGRKLLRRVLLVAAAGFGVLMVLGIISAAVTGPTPAATTTAADAPAASSPAPAAPASPAPVAPKAPATQAPAPAPVRAAAPATHPSAPAPVATPAPADSTQQSTTDTAFLLALDNDHIQYASPAAALQVAHSICNGYESGLTTLQIASTMEGYGYTNDQVGFMIGAAAAGYCPGYAPSGG